MIQSKQDLKYYLKCDKIALDKHTKRPRAVKDIIWKYQIIMRKCAYYANVRKDLFGKIMSKIYNFRFLRLGHRLGFSIAYNSFGPGLALVHYGCTVVNGAARIGENCRIHEGVTIGANATTPKVPRIGKNVYIASGAKIIGDVEIADGVVVGAGAVVVKSILEPNITVGGVPAKKISDNDSTPYLIRATEIIAEQKALAKK